MAKNVENRRKSVGVRHKQEVDETSQNCSTALHVHVSSDRSVLDLTDARFWRPEASTPNEKSVCCTLN
jgi:hypothetical protein